MHTISINKFGGSEELKPQDLPLPTLDANEVLIRVEYAGVGPWDPAELHGEFEQYKSEKSHFPYILGSEGAGVIEAVGTNVKNFKIGDKVYASGFLNPKGGFYAEYVAIDEDLVFHVPKNLSLEQAAVMSGVGITALRGIEDTLNLKPGECILIFGASGGIGHLAVQIAKRLKARVVAVASGKDGVNLVSKLNPDVVLDGHSEDLVEQINQKIPDGLDAILLTAGGKQIKELFKCLKPQGRVVAPNGVTLPTETVPLVKTYDGNVEHEILERFHKMAESGKFEVHVSQIFPLEKVVDAHQALSEHHLGKLALKVH
ncbi:zinc-binding dehydrogenase [Bdellovibrio bacteriovorus]|uniref:Zinc-binding dehydrogenase n=2 Tax=Pseudobdellovibrionaceae TaxID=213483 RepID=A0A162FV35_BDEBC|nr:zinc-binding dehydrogenase [Bdellovibrio bacteriovorus]